MRELFKLALAGSLSIQCGAWSLSGQTPDYPKQGAKASPPASMELDVTYQVQIPMRDGVLLSATLYRPRKALGPLPCVFALTPYVRQRYLARGKYFAANGYVFAVVDVRGRGDSGGAFHPFIQEARDGHDVVEWLAAQPFCDGKVAMWGYSYGGYDQWATAKEGPPHLAAIAPVASCFPGVDFPPAMNIKQPYLMQWLTFISGHTLQANYFADGSFWLAGFRRIYDEHKAFKDLDQLCGNPSPIFQEWLKHPLQDDYWDAFVPTSAQYQALTLPILTITGQYDGDQAGALEHYRRHMAAAGPEARALHFLIIGPWDHDGTMSPKAEFDGLKIGPTSLVDTNALFKAWYDWTLKGGPKPSWLAAPVAYYMTGREAWRYAPSLDGVTGEKRLLFLDSRMGASDPFASGTLSSTKAKGGFDSYVYDPLDTRPCELASDLEVPGLTDQRYVLLNHGNSLIYNTAPFDSELDIAGMLQFEAYIAIDQADTDFEADLFDLAPDGSSLLLGSTVVRARYRENLRSAKPVVPGRIEHYTFKDFGFVARAIAKGHRLRFVLGPSNNPNIEKNYNSGGAVEEETGKDARTVVVKLYHDSGHPSALVLPIAAMRD